MTLRWRFLLPFLAILAISPEALSNIALAAKARPSADIKSNLVKLSDLFSDLEPGQDCDIGPAPSPGSRIIIGQLQLIAIAAQFGVDWQSGAVPVQIIIERKARAVTRGELMPLIRSALRAEAAPDDSDINIGAYTTTTIPAELTSQPTLESLAYDRSNGHFSAQLLFDAPGVEPISFRIAGTVQEMISIPVLTHAMAAGSVIMASDLMVKRMRKGLVGDRTLLIASEAEGLALRHRIMGGDPVSLDELSRPLLVSRGMSVVLRLEDTGLVLMATGQAIEDGALGDRIHVLNPSSRAVLVARITGTAAVQVDPTNTPVMLTSQQSGLPSAYSMASLMQPLSQNEPVR